MALDLSPLPAQRAGVKRPHSSLIPSPQSETATKKRRIHHSIQHVQTRPTDIEPAPQDPIFAQGQLLKSIGAALVSVGFDGVRSSALEMFRSHVEEYMLRFLMHTRASMADGRRTKPTALDFASALANTPNAETASLLKPQLHLQIPEAVSRPQIPEPNPAEAPTADLSELLHPLIERNTPSFIPKHFPARPPDHAWKQTAVFPERERDPKRMREKATEEGMLAEQALRRLAAAAKAGAVSAEKRRSIVLSGEGKVRDPRSQRRRTRVHEDTFADVLKELGDLDELASMGTETIGNGVDLTMAESIAVNSDTNHWRRVGSRR